MCVPIVKTSLEVEIGVFVVKSPMIYVMKTQKLVMISNKNLISQHQGNYFDYERQSNTVERSP